MAICTYRQPVGDETCVASPKCKNPMLPYTDICMYPEDECEFCTAYTPKKPELKVFDLTDIRGTVYHLDGESVESVFNKIDGLRLMGERWLKVYSREQKAGKLQKIPMYLNIEHIVSIQ